MLCEIINASTHAHMLECSYRAYQLRSGSIAPYKKYWRGSSPPCPLRAAASDVHVCTHVHAHIHVHIHAHVHVYIRIYIHVHAVNIHLKTLQLTLS